MTAADLIAVAFATLVEDLRRVGLTAEEAASRLISAFPSAPTAGTPAVAGVPAAALADADEENRKMTAAMQTLSFMVGKQAEKKIPMVRVPKAAPA